MDNIFVWLMIWNVIVALIYGIDKYKAEHDLWRISERTLLTCAFLMGGAGAILGMSIFRHKTRKPKFKALVPLAFLLNCAALYYVGKTGL